MTDYNMMKQSGLVLSAGSESSIASFEVVELERLYLKTNCKQLDINWYVGGDNIGVSLERLVDFSINTPNGDWYVSKIDTSTSPNTYYAVWVPQRTYQGVDLTLENTSSSGCRIHELTITYIEDKFEDGEEERETGGIPNITPGG